jgi:potassium/hydrogen antiporter
MDITIENILFIGSALLLISILAGKTSYRFGVPTLIFFLVVGMLAGSEGLGGIQFDDPQIAQFVGIVALNFILFSGGLDTDWNTIKPVLWQGVSLSTLGVLFTATSVGVFVWAVTDFSIYEGLLLGGIISSTDAAAVFSILRSKSLGLKSRLRPTLELESGSNDPMAYFLTIVFLGFILNPQQDIWGIIPMFFYQISLGAIMGFLFGKISKYVLNQIMLDFEGLYFVLMVGLMFFIFSTTDTLGGNGFLAVYLSAVYLGNQDFIHKNSILKAFDGHAWLMQIVMFLTLGLLVFPSEVVPFIGIGILISAFLIVVARPIAVFLCLSPFKMKFRRRAYISWVGLRGAVPIVFATYPLLAGIEKADAIFNIVFFISVSSVLVQGTTLPLIAKWLHVTLPEKVKPITPVDRLLNENIKSEMAEIALNEDNEAIGKRIVELNFPKTAIIAMIQRNGRYIIPSGSTELMPKDVLIVLAENKESISQVYDLMLKGGREGSHKG